MDSCKLTYPKKTNIRLFLLQVEKKVLSFLLLIFREKNSANFDTKNLFWTIKRTLNFNHFVALFWTLNDHQEYVWYKSNQVIIPHTHNQKEPILVLDYTWDINLPWDEAKASQMIIKVIKIHENVPLQTIEVDPNDHQHQIKTHTDPSFLVKMSNLVSPLTNIVNTWYDYQCS